MKMKQARPGGILIVLGYPVIQDQPRKTRHGGEWIIQPCFAGRPQMVEFANGARYLRPNIWKLLEGHRVHLNTG